MSVIVTIVLFQTQLLEKPLEPILVSVVLLYRCLNAALCANFWVGTLTNVGSVESGEKVDLDVSERQSWKNTQVRCWTTPLNLTVSFTYEGRPDPTLDRISILMPQITLMPLWESLVLENLRPCNSSSVATKGVLPWAECCVAGQVSLAFKHWDNHAGCHSLRRYDRKQHPIG